MKKICLILIIFLTFNLFHAPKKVYAVSPSPTELQEMAWVADWFNNAYANAGGFTGAKTLVAGGSVTGAVTAISSGVSLTALWPIAIVAIGAGVVFYNREEIVTFCSDVYRRLSNKCYMSDELTQEFSDKILAEIQDMKKNSSISVFDDEFLYKVYAKGWNKWVQPYPVITESIPSGYLPVMYFYGKLTSSVYRTDCAVASNKPYITFYNDKGEDAFRGEVIYSDSGIDPHIVARYFIRYKKIDTPVKKNIDYTRNMPSNLPTTLPLPKQESLNQAPKNLDNYVGVGSSSSVTPENTVPLDGVTPFNPSENNPDDFSLPSELKLDFTPLQLNLKDKFPFCIPFDLAKSVKNLSVTPKAPVFQIDYDKNYFVGGGSFTIDFSMFEIWAKIARWGILIAFVFGLIIVTRNLIRG